MRFDLSSEAQGEWFKFFKSVLKENGETEYFPPEEDAGKVCIRNCTPEIIEKIHAETRKKVSELALNPKTRSMERVIYYDQTPEQEKKEREMIWDFVIQGWEGILDKEGKDIPCTVENKMKLMTRSPQFARFVGRCLQIVTGADAESEEAVGKN
jgi:hypothetical protein